MGYEAEICQPLPRDEWEQREIYAKFGLAVFFCQVVEAGLVNYLMLLQRATEGGVATTSQVDDLFAEFFGNTLGRNINNVKRVLGEQGEWVLADQMADVLKLRNELIHSWMRTRVLRQGTSENRLAMIEELEQAISVLQDADAVLTERTQTMFSKAGIPEEFVQSELQRLTQLAERGEEDPNAPGYFSMQPDR